MKDLQGEKLHQILLKQFGWDQFRGAQEQTLRSILAGRSTLAIMPTGLGKSLCYQLLAFLPETELILVVSPLIALMEDQQTRARKLGIDSFYINSSLSNEERSKRYKRLASGQGKLIFVTPERFRKGEFQEAISHRRVSYFVVDEAHCISLWGHDFRPDYSQLSRLREQLGQPVTLALTATATPLVQADIEKQLSIEETHRTSFARPELALSVLSVVGLAEKVRAIVGLKHLHPGPMVVYVSLISHLYELSNGLASVGLSHLLYHGDLNAQERKRQQQNFFADTESLLLATPAFGLGVDKANIRSVVHADVPATLEAYYQEVGRAGRDGDPAHGVLLYDADDLSIQREFLNSAYPDLADVLFVQNWVRRNLSILQAQGLRPLKEALSFANPRDHRVETSLRHLEKVGAVRIAASRWGYEWIEEVSEMELRSLTDPQLKKNALRALGEMMSYANQTTGCRFQTILQHFAEVSAPCGRCDLCLQSGPPVRA